MSVTCFYLRQESLPLGRLFSEPVAACEGEASITEVMMDTKMVLVVLKKLFVEQ